MAEEVPQKNFLGSAFEAAASGIEHIIEPQEKTMWHTLTHKWLNLQEWVEYMGDAWGISRGLFLCCLFVPLFIIAQILLPQFFSLTFGWILLALPILAVVGMAAGWWSSWVWYAQSYFLFTRLDPILLEVKMPTDVQKSPRAMEQVFTNLWIKMGETTYIDKYWSGGQRPFFSFEIVSFGGDIRFFIWGRRMFKNTIESSIYAQYPEVEVVEAEDYASKFIYDETKECFVTEYTLDSKIPGISGAGPFDTDSARINAYPPKTYVDFELDENPKEEHRVDPYASVMEVMSAINKDEQMWLQMVIRLHKGSWQKVVETEVERVRLASTKLTGAIKEDEDAAGFPRPTWRQTEQIRTMERHLSKLSFDTGFRGIYIAPMGRMRGPEYTRLRGIWRPFANPQWMSYLNPTRGHNIFDWPWQDWYNLRYRLISRRFLDAYRRRCFYNYPWFTIYNVFSTEVLATLWHPPTSSVVAPGLRRIPVTKGEAPANLPM